MSDSPATDRRRRRVLAPDSMYVRDRFRAQDQKVPALQVSLNALDLWAFILPAVSFVEITIVGRLIVSEILVVALLPWLWSAADRPRIPRWFLLLWAGWLLGAAILGGVTVSDYAVIGANAVVVRDVEAADVAVGGAGQINPKCRSSGGR